jgi:hypothetical protein
LDHPRDTSRFPSSSREIRGFPHLQSSPNLFLAGFIFSLFAPDSNINAQVQWRFFVDANREETEAAKNKYGEDP